MIIVEMKTILNNQKGKPKMKKIVVILYLALLLATSGCAGRMYNKMVHKLSKSRTGAKNAAYQIMPFPDLSEPLSNPEKCRIYLMRDTYAGLQWYEVYDNGHIVGVVQAYTYLCWERSPGTMTILCKNAQINTPSKTKQTFTVEAGQTYYIKQGIGFFAEQSMGLLGGVKMKMVDEEKGVKAIEKCTAPEIKNVMKTTKK